MSSTSKSDENRKTSSSKDGDWTCAESECKNLNFARRGQCNRCGKDRPSSSAVSTEICNSSSSSSGSCAESHPGSKKKVGIEIGKVAAEKSRGLFSAEDWQCSKCANVNWARRHTCNLCNAPRFCEVEERTGYGGGYNDRGVVEYKDRVDSDDDEYDEFGRRKKKGPSSDYRSKPAREPQAKKSYRKPAIENEHDDDDDDDDDGNEDLSKYDLWGSDAEDNSKDDKMKQSNIVKRKSSPSSKTAASNSRSRSRSPRSRSDRTQNRKSYYRKYSRSRSRSPRGKNYSSSYYRR